MINETIAPKRSDLLSGSRVICNTSRFVVSLLKTGLVIQKHRTGTGVLLPVSHKQFIDYLEAFEHALDDSEINDLCKALI